MIHPVRGLVLDPVPQGLEFRAVQDGLPGFDRDPLVGVLHVQLAGQLAQDVPDLGQVRLERLRELERFLDQRLAQFVLHPALGVHVAGFPQVRPDGFRLGHAQRRCPPRFVGHRDGGELVRNRPVDQLDQPGWLGCWAQGDGQHGDFQVLAYRIPVFGHADVGGLERGDPEHFLDATRDLPFVGGGGRALFQQQLFRHPLIHAGVGWQGQGVDERGDVHGSASPFRRRARVRFVRFMSDFAVGPSEP